MPTYEYQCSACGHKLEIVQSIKSNPRKKCPKCRRKKLQRLISQNVSIIFKGNDFWRSEEYVKQKCNEEIKEKGVVQDGRKNNG